MKSYTPILAAAILMVLIAATTIFAQTTNKNQRDETMTKKLETATLAGGCFWCLESDLEGLEGVVEVVSGYTGGPEQDPTYEQVASGRTGHYEAVQVHFDPEVVGFETILDYFWRHIDPTDDSGQFVDRGKQYRTAIFFHDEEQKRLALESKKRLDRSGVLPGPVVTPILEFTRFWDAEEYHQGFYKKSPGHYKRYRSGSGRDQFIAKYWTDKTDKGEDMSGYTRPSKEELKESLTPEQYRVTQKNGTEPPFHNKYWDSEKEGIYVDVVSGEPLFSSTHKFDSGSGWPSFRQPLEKGNIVKLVDDSLFETRTEVRSKHADSHLGHVFNDGPAPTFKRYCINSAALRFVPKDDLEKEGLGRYLELFK